MKVKRKFVNFVYKPVLENLYPVREIFCVLRANMFVTSNLGFGFGAIITIWVVVYGYRAAKKSLSGMADLERD